MRARTSTQALLVFSSSAKWTRKKKKKKVLFPGNFKGTALWKRDGIGTCGTAVPFFFIRGIYYKRIKKLYGKQVILWEKKTYFFSAFSDFWPSFCM